MKCGRSNADKAGFSIRIDDKLVGLEYDPAEYPVLIGPILRGKADAVFGSGFIGSQEHGVLYFWHSVGNRFLALLSNMVTNLNLTDMETCYKPVRREILQAILIVENQFGFEPEITAKLAKRNLRIYEVAVSCHGRTAPMPRGRKSDGRMVSASSGASRNTR